MYFGFRTFGKLASLAALTLVLGAGCEDLDLDDDGDAGPDAAIGDDGGNGNGTDDDAGNGGNGGDVPSPPECGSPEPLSEDINQDTTLSPEDGECLVVDSVVTVSDANLTLEPGVILVFEEDAGLSIESGTLTAEGTAEDPIWLMGTEKTRGFWNGLHVSGTKSTDNILDNVHILHAGSGGYRGAGSAGLMLNSSGAYGDPLRIEIRNSSVRESESAGLWAAEGGADIAAFANNTLTSNAGPAVRMHPANVSQLDSESSYTGNDEEHLSVTGGTIKDGEHTWPEVDVEYRLTGGIDITEEAHLALSPGSTFVAEEDVGFNIDGGSFAAEGGESEAKQIVFTGAEEIPGYWSGIHFEGTKSSDNKLNWVVIEYAGGSSYRGSKSAGLMLNSTGAYGAPLRIAIDNTTVRYSANFGLFVESPHATITSFQNNSLVENEGAAADIHPGVLGSIDETSTYADNADNYVRVQNGSVSDGEEHTWSAIDAPYRFPNNVDIEEGSHVDIEAGTTLEFEANKGLNVEGATLAANGTESDEVLFRGSEQTAGFWGGLQFSTTESEKNALNYTTLRHGGGNSFRGASDAALMLNSSGAYGGALRIHLESIEISDFDPGAAVFTEGGTTLTDCSSLTGFAAEDVIGDGADDFRTECGL